MKDVAREAGVSLMTVSYALRNHSSVSASTKARVQAIAKALGYTPNPLVSALITQVRQGRDGVEPQIIGYISAYAEQRLWMDNSTAFKYYSGAAARCKELGFKLETFELTRFGMNPKRLSDVMFYRNVRGIICAPMPCFGSTIALEWANFSSVAFGYSMPAPAINRASCHHYEAARMALSRLRALGYHRVGFATTQTASERIDDGFLSAVDIDNRNIPPEVQVVPWVAGRREATSKKLVQWFRRQKPDVILTDIPRIFEWLKRENLSVPDDVAVAITSWHEGSPAAGINQNSEFIGAAAVEMLVQQIYHNERGVPQHARYNLVAAQWENGMTAPGL